jgi:hypothetical protein
MLFSRCEHVALQLQQSQEANCCFWCQLGSFCTAAGTCRQLLSSTLVCLGLTLG